MGDVGADMMPPLPRRSTEGCWSIDVRASRGLSGYWGEESPCAC